MLNFITLENLNGSIPGGVQDQVGWSPGQPDLVSDNPAHGGGTR